MRRYRSIVIVAIISALFIPLGIIYFQQSATFTAFWDSFRPKGEQIINIQISPPKESDKLFTAFAYMPILDYKKENTTIEGLCSRQYEVGIGYNNIRSLFDQYHEAACQNNVQTMPEPIILSTNTVESKVKGDYEQKTCDSWDRENKRSGQRLSHKLILKKLLQDGQWLTIAENSQRVLTGYLRIYCSEALVNP